MDPNHKMPPGQVLALAAAAVGPVPGYESIHGETLTSEAGVLVSTLVEWKDEDGLTIQSASVLADGSVVL